ncbi:MAG: hypothetical protein AAF170_02835 [Bacteroidota bacterium]
MLRLLLVLLLVGCGGSDSQTPEAAVPASDVSASGTPETRLARSSAPAARDSSADAIYIIMDGSGSMWGQLPDNSRKVTVAKTVLSDFVRQDFGDTELALRAYGHRREGDCRDSELVVPFGSAETVVPQVETFSESLNPLGKTPIAYSLREALVDMDGRSGEIILITDGNETCDDDPCALVRAWREQNIDINVHVVGLGIEEKERGALQCIADASGTSYRDASTADELADELRRIRRESVSGARNTEPPTFGSVGLYLRGVDTRGEERQVEGVLMQDGRERYAVDSDSRHPVEAGAYDLVAGMRTANGTLYRPVRRPVTMADENQRVEVAVAVPPSVNAVFMEEGEERRGATVVAYQNGAEVFRFRSFDTVHLDEGTYTFRTNLNQDNELTVTETFGAGDDKTIRFEAIATVDVRVSMYAGSRDVRLQGNYDLWQNGEKVYDMHTSNGADIRPGVYDVHLENELTPHVERGVVVPSTPEQQHIQIVVPVAFVTFAYERADGSRDEDRRVFVGRDGERRRTKQSGVRVALLPGAHTAVGWPGRPAPVAFEVEAGEERTIVLRSGSR